MLKVLAAIDGSILADRAVEHAVKLATKGTPIEVLLLHVQPEIVPWQTHGMAQDAIVAHRRELSRRAAEIAERVLQAADIRYQLRIETGDPAETITRVAGEQGSDLIVMGTRGMGAIESLVIGSVAYKVVHLAKAPVTLVK